MSDSAAYNEALRRFVMGAARDLGIASEQTEAWGLSLEGVLDGFLNSLISLAQNRPIVILVDELEFVGDARSSLRKLFETIGFHLKARYGEHAIHYIACGSDDVRFSGPYALWTKLVNQQVAPEKDDYPAVAATDPSPIPVPCLTREEVESLFQILSSQQPGGTCDPRVWFDDLALDLIVEHTGGHPLLVQLLMRYFAEQISAGYMPLPIAWPEVYELLCVSSPNTKYAAGINELRDEMRNTANLIWNKLGQKTRQRLQAILELETVEGFNELRELGLLRVDDIGRPQMRIGILDEIYKSHRD